MSHLDPDRLMALAFGGQPADPAQAEHLSRCAVCRTELAEVGDLVALGRQTRGLADLPAPPAVVWERIAAEVGVPAEAGAPDPVLPGAPDPVLPGAGTAGDAGAGGPGRAGADQPSRPGGRGPETRRARLRLALVAAVAALAGVAGTLAVNRALAEPEPSVRVVAEADLAPFGRAPRSAHGSARIVDTAQGRQLHLEVGGMPAPDGFYEIWLYDPAADIMVPMGNLGAGPSVVLPVPPALDVTSYTVVDVSAEPLNGDPAHGESMLRGTLG